MDILFNHKELNSFYKSYLNQEILFCRLISTRTTSIRYIPFLKQQGKLVSLPFLSYASFFVFKDLTQIHLGPDFFIDQGLIKCKQKGMSWEIRGFKPFSKHFLNHKVLSVISLKNNQSAYYSTLNAHTLRKIKKSSAIGLKLLEGREELLTDFFTIYQGFSAGKRIPAYSIDFFKSWLKAPSGLGHIFLVQKEGENLAAAFLIGGEQFKEIMYLVGVGSYRKDLAHYFLISALISLLRERRCLYLSLGRSDFNSGVHQFKKLWRPADLPLYFSSSKPIVNKWKLKVLYSCIYPFIPSKWRMYLEDFICRNFF